MGARGEADHGAHLDARLAQQLAAQRHPVGIHAHRCEAELRRLAAQLLDLLARGVGLEQRVVDERGQPVAGGAVADGGDDARRAGLGQRARLRRAAHRRDAEVPATLASLGIVAVGTRARSGGRAPGTRSAGIAARRRGGDHERRRGTRNRSSGVAAQLLQHAPRDDVDQNLAIDRHGEGLLSNRNGRASSCSILALRMRLRRSSQYTIRSGANSCST